LIGARRSRWQGLPGVKLASSYDALRTGIVCWMSPICVYCAERRSRTVPRTAGEYQYVKLQPVPLRNGSESSRIMCTSTRMASNAPAGVVSLSQPRFWKP
jgi:hypothetical protein